MQASLLAGESSILTEASLEASTLKTEVPNNPSSIEPKRPLDTAVFQPSTFPPMTIVPKEVILPTRSSGIDQEQLSGMPHDSTAGAEMLAEASCSGKRKSTAVEDEEHTPHKRRYLVVEQDQVREQEQIQNSSGRRTRKKSWKGELLHAEEVDREARLAKQRAQAAQLCKTERE